MNCPLCEKELIVDKRNMWLLCSSNDHKFKLAEWDDTTRKSITRQILSKSIMALKNGLNQDGIDKTNQDLINGQIHAYQMLADYLCDDDWRDFLPIKE